MGVTFPLSFFSFSYIVSPLFSLVRFIIRGQAWAEDKGELATCRFCADSGRELGEKNVRSHSLHRLNTSMIKQKKK